MQIFLVETHWTDPRHKTIIHSHLLWLEHPIWMKTYHYRVKDLSKCLIRLTIISMAHHYKAYCHKHLNYSTPLNRIIFTTCHKCLKITGTVWHRHIQMIVAIFIISGLNNHRFSCVVIFIDVEWQKNTDSFFFVYF